MCKAAGIEALTAKINGIGTGINGRKYVIQRACRR